MRIRAKRMAHRARSENALRLALGPLPNSTLTRNQSSAPFENLKLNGRHRAHSC
jgi:hypothetical protein